MRISLIVVVLIISAPAIAQDVPPIVQRPVVVEKILRPAGNADLYEVAIDGSVYVDWQLVERIATAPRGNSQQAVAQMMLAVRDGKSKAFTARP